MLDWENLRYFAALAHARTLSGAARALGVEHATVSRRVAALEAQMGEKLVDRRGRRLLLTQEGERIAAMIDRMGNAALAIEREMANSNRGLAGEVRISAPPALAGSMLVEPLIRLRRRHPEVRVTVVGETRFASLDRREADIAVRLTRPEEGDLTVTKIGEVGFGFYASAAYVAETPEHAWTFISYDETMAASPQTLLLMEAAGMRSVGLRATTLEFQLRAAKAGGGVAILPDFAVKGEAGLVRVLDDGPVLVREMWLVVHSDIRNVPIIRAVMEALKE